MIQKNKAMKMSFFEMAFSLLIITFVFLAIGGIIQRIFNQ